MRLSIEFDWSLIEDIRGLKQKWLEYVCKKKGHIWKKYVEGEDIYHFSSMFDLWNNLGEITHECTRCGGFKRKKQKPEKLKIKNYSKLKVKKK